MNYTLKRFDKNLAVFSISIKEVDDVIIFKECISELPLPLKRIVKEGYSEEFVEQETNDYFILNDSGCWLFESWLSDRQVPVGRDNYKKYVSKDSSPRELLLDARGFSHTDSYWIEKEGDSLNWSIIEAWKSMQGTMLFHYENKGLYPKNNSTLGGQLEKFWFTEGDKTMLYKKSKVGSSILNVREILASIIYEKQGSIPHCTYIPVQDKYSDEWIACVTECFTSSDLELVTAYELLEEFNMTQVTDVYEKIIELASNYGLDKAITQAYMDTQTIVDYLITNRDRHQGNIGFIRDAKTLRIISPAPIYDSGSSAHLEGEWPEDAFHTKVNALYMTECECLSHVKDFNIVDVDKLPDKYELKDLLTHAGLNESRREFLINLYLEKIKVLKHLQNCNGCVRDIRRILNLPDIEEDDILMSAARTGSITK